VVSDRPVALTRTALTTPRAAAVAGIAFGILYGTSLVLLRLSIPIAGSTDNAELNTDPRWTILALNLVPYAGIAFLWFIGVIRDRVGDLEDRFFATIFLGSGLLFVGLTFVGGALAGGLLTIYETEQSDLITSDSYNYGRAVMYNIVNVYAIRMAGVFMISLSTIWIRTSIMHRAWPFATFVLALVLLVSDGYYPLIILIFPGWVLTVSVHLLIRNVRNKPPETIHEVGSG
jgi:hypothetical protein